MMNWFRRRLWLEGRKAGIVEGLEGAVAQDVSGASSVGMVGGYVDKVDGRASEPAGEGEVGNQHNIYKCNCVKNKSNLRIVNMLPGDLAVAGCFYISIGGLV